MQKTAIDNDYLDALLLQLIAYSQKDFPPLAAAYQLLYDTGARFHEISYLEEWEFLEEGKLIQYPTLKHETMRIFPSSFLSPGSINLIASDGELIKHISYNRARCYMQQRLSRYYLLLNNKKLHLHAFRHAFARRLYHKKYSLPTIQQYMGLKSTRIAEGYVGRPIYQVS